MPERQTPIPIPVPFSAEDRLESWKEIAAYLGREVRTVQGWEKAEGLPVHRHQHSRQGSVYAFRSELDAWRRGRNTAPYPAEIVTLDSEAADSRAISEMQFREQNANRWRKFAVWLAVILLGAAVWITFAWMRRDEGPLTAIPLTTYPGSERFATFSPDGTQVAFSWDGEKQENFDIYVSVIGSGGPLRITKDPAPDFYPAWSPDGRCIAFVRLLGSNKASIILVPPLGGAERKVTDVEVYPSVAYSIGVNPPRVAWSADAKSLVVVDRSYAGEPFSLFLVAVDTGEKRRLTFPKDVSSMDSGPAVSPDGQSLVFTRSSGNLGVGDLYLLSSFDGPHPGPVRRLTFDNQQNGHPAWTADGHEIVFTSARGRGSLNLWRLNPGESKGPKRLAGAGEDGIFPALSRDRHRLAYTKYSLDSNIWRIEMGSPTAAAALISSTRQDVMPRLSPDGNKVAFSSDRSGNFQIWTCNQDGSNPVQLTFFAGVSFAPAWSPDGKRIVFSSNKDGSFKVYVVDANGGTPRAITNNTAGGGWPFFSRDGKWVYFNSDQRGRDEIWKVPSAGGPAVQLTHSGGYMPQESPDGRCLYFMKSFASGPLYRAPLTGGAETVVLESIAARGYAITNKGIYFAAAGAKTDDREYYEVRSNKKAILFLDFATGQQRVVAAGQPPLQLGIAASADGRSVLFSRLDRMDEDLMLVDNFR